ncbi:hypothetical protein NMG60_11022476 [Bertholletia excelsa]
MARREGIVINTSRPGDGDIQEEDVWAVMNEQEESQHSRPKVGRNSPSAKYEVKFFHHHQYHQPLSSSPVKTPNWSEIYRKNSRKVISEGSFHAYHGGDTDGDGDGDGMVPPHEYIARKLARSQISSFSMCEGIGRTLKGRDLRKVRNAVLTKTGFLE